MRDEPLATPEAVARAAYTAPGPKYLTLVTMKNTSSGNGAHSGLIINASQRVLWDPAGTFGHELIPERNDVHFGVTPQIEQYYISYHSRITYYTLLQKLIVPADVAELALERAIANGPTPKSMCTIHTSRLLKSLPGFESIRQTMFPNNLADRFGLLPGVEEWEYRENDDDDKSIAAAQIDEAIRADQ